MFRRSESRRRENRHRGAILPFVVVSMIAILGFVALAVDLGMIAVARTQCQNAADSAAMAAARTLNGDVSTNYNQGNVVANYRVASSANAVLAQSIANSQVSVSIGSYTYDYTAAKFVQTIPTASTDTPNLAQATVTGTGQYSFSRIFGINSFTTSTTAVAVHRPRDVAVILDMSGSMKFDSILGIPYSGNRTQSNNPETVYPTFGHYSSSSLTLSNASGPDLINGDSYGLANISVDSDSGDAMVKDFQQNNKGAATIAAFTPASDTYASAPAGDTPMKKNLSSTFATNVQEVTGVATNPFIGYTLIPYLGYLGPVVPEFAGYTQGPRHWGKTFWIWPPDPRSGKDWRAKFFYKYGTTTPIDDNNDLWDSSGVWLAPGSGNYSINYTAILAWIKQTPNPFPSQLRAGRILYYDSIPSTISTSAFPPTDPNQRFWKEYIDSVLGVYQTSATNYDQVVAMSGYGDNFNWGTPKIYAKPTATLKNLLNLQLFVPPMDPRDNPERPQTHFWFGPMTMIDFLANYNQVVNYGVWNFYLPGNCHEGPAWACKLGIQAAMQDIQRNHPNDYVSMVFYNRPQNNATDASGAFNRTRVPLGRDYQRLSDTLWFPPSTIDSPGTEIRPYDAANVDVPRASRGTATVMGFMLAFNQFSGATALRTYAPSPSPTGEAGGLGRKGSQKLVILQTDGMANTAETSNFTNGGSYNSYYNIRMPYEFPTNSGSDVPGQIATVANQICALDTASPPGYSTARKPVLIHCLAEGPIFDASSGSSQKTPALNLLQNIQTIGAVQTSASTPLASYKIITGNSADRTSKIQQAFSTIMQDGVQVSLIQ